LVTGPKPTKGKPTKIQQTNPIDVDDLDESSSLLSLADDSEGDKNGSDDEDGEDDNDYDVAQMSDGEARRMFNDEVLFDLQFILSSEVISPSCPRLQIMQLRCSKMITTSKSPLPSPIAVSGGPARKLHDPQHLNPKGCSTIEGIRAKGRLTTTTISLGTFSCLLEVLIGRNLTR
jgi:hypothetical protein